MSNLSFAEQIEKIKGKTIENVIGTNYYRPGEDGVNQLIIYFTDGTEISFSSNITFQGNEGYGAESEIEIP